MLTDSGNNDEQTFKDDSTKINEDDSQANRIKNLSSDKNLDASNQDTNKEKNPTAIKEKVINEISKNDKLKPKKETPIEKKPFNEFVNSYLLPSLIQEFKERGFEVLEITLKNTFRPVAGDKCWVIYCEIKDICNFWLSFEKDDITSQKSISLCKPSQTPSVIESFLIDEKRITLKLIISRILQRLNGQKLIGVN